MAAHTGKTTVHSRYGTKVAVLAGDYLFAQSSYYLAHLDNLEVRFFPKLYNGDISMMIHMLVTCFLA